MSDAVFLLLFALFAIVCTVAFFERRRDRNSAQSKVRLFHRVMGLGEGDLSSPAICNGELRIALLEEELEEFRTAVRSGDLVAAVDALCDIEYVTLGAGVAFGVDLDPAFDAVHRSNMAKAGGAIRADGKKLKPIGWIPPDIASVLQRQREEHR